MVRYPGPFLQSLRIKLRCSQREFADLIQLSYAHTSQIEAGKRLPSWEVLLRWLDAGGGRIEFIGPDGPDPLDQLTPEERHLIETFRALPPEHRRLVHRFATALPGHDIAREGVVLALSLLEKSGIVHASSIRTPAASGE